jgi:hypothetical protein
MMRDPSNTAPILVGDVWQTREMARAAAAYLRQRGHKASVETSGPPGQREHRVWVAHSTDPGLGAYFSDEDTLDNYEPTWVTTCA